MREILQVPLAHVYLLAGAVCLSIVAGGDPIASAQTEGENEAAANPSEAPRRVTLQLDRPVAVGELRILWRELEDSRCPAGVECVWAGKVAVSLVLCHHPGAREEIELSLRPGGAAEPVKLGRYEARLLRVEPRPRRGVVPARNQYVAVLELTPSGTRDRQD